MQHRYVGDVGDFGKYALLRRLTGVGGEMKVRLGIVWCLFPNESHNMDGKYVSYLDAPHFRDLDPDLLMALRNIVTKEERLVTSVLSAGILPTETVSCEEPVTVPGLDRIATRDRISYRSEWLRRCFERTEACDLVFFDPDNGIETASVPKHHPRAGKYIYWNELQPFWRRGNTLLIYHHLNRTVSTAQQIQVLRLRFRSEFDDAVIVPLVFRRGSSRVFCLVHHADKLGRELERRAAVLLDGGWSRHFRPLGWPGNDHAGTRAPSRSIT
jgi:hypothetical protein